MSHAKLKLIGSMTSPYARKARIVAAEKRIDILFVPADPWSPQSGIPELNPLGKVPVLVLEDGTPLYDSRVIVEFLDGVSPIAKLIPADHRDRIEIRRWEALADGVLDAGILARLEAQRPTGERSQGWIARQMATVERGLTAMDRELDSRAWCAGSGFSLADIAVGCCLGWLEFRFPDLAWRARCANLVRHQDKVADRPAFADTVPHA
ncbi:MAG: glutathione S-transferase N-terminal domain-containing protein [Burkholderiales bacterium]|nr:glutathione S-transferase N-terminal domain-containing protein [Burkholderiales bacterium]